MKPLIVMGMGRSGTRYFADILSAHESVQLYGEIPHSAMARFISLLNALDKEHERDSQRKKKWEEKKLPFIFEGFKSMSMGAVKEKGECLYVGHKTPRSELHFDSYEKHFANVGVSVKYFYCLRNPLDVWASFKNMPWNAFEDAGVFLEYYNESYRRYVRAGSKAKGRVHLLNLDDFKKDSNPKEFIEKNVFSPLELHLEDGFLDSLVSVENKNSSQNFIGRQAQSLPSEDVKKIFRNRETSLIIREHFPWLA